MRTKKKSAQKIENILDFKSFVACLFVDGKPPCTIALDWIGNRNLIQSIKDCAELSYFSWFEEAIKDKSGWPTKEQFKQIRNVLNGQLHKTTDPLWKEYDKNIANLQNILNDNLKKMSKEKSFEEYQKQKLPLQHRLQIELRKANRRYLIALKKWWLQKIND